MEKILRSVIQGMDALGVDMLHRELCELAEFHNGEIVWQEKTRQERGAAGTYSERAVCHRFSSEYSWEDFKDTAEDLTMHSCFVQKIEEVDADALRELVAGRKLESTQVRMTL